MLIYDAVQIYVFRGSHSAGLDKSQICVAARNAEICVVIAPILIQSYSAHHIYVAGFTYVESVVYTVIDIAGQISACGILVFEEGVYIGVRCYYVVLHLPRNNQLRLSVSGDVSIVERNPDKIQVVAAV